MNIYGKLAEARSDFHALSLKKSGKNSFAGYSYFELADFLIPGMEVLHNHGLVPVISFDENYAAMTIYEIDGDGHIPITSPMRDANLKGCHPIQNLGAVETYQRRYLWMAALEIVEHDALGSSAAADAVDNTPVTQKQAALLRDELESVDGDERAFCKYLKVDALEQIAARNFDTARSMIAKKRKAA